MDKAKRLVFNDRSIKFLLGYIEVSVINISYEPPVPGRYFTPHSHGTYELHYIPEGKGVLHVNHKQYPILPGTFYLTGPGVLHEQIADENQPMSEYCLNFETRLLKNCHSKSSYYIRDEMNHIAELLQKVTFWFGKDEFSTFSVFERLYAELENKWIGYFSCIQNLASQIIINSVRNFAACKKAQYEISAKMPDDKRRMIIDDYFRKYDRPLKPSVLATMLCVSERQLDRLMKQYYSVSFKQKLLATRVAIAGELLRNTDLTVYEISRQVGFSNTSHFYKAFVKAFGTLPKEYRNFSE